VKLLNYIPLRTVIGALHHLEGRWQQFGKPVEVRLNLPAVP